MHLHPGVGGSLSSVLLDLQVPPSSPPSSPPSLPLSCVGSSSPLQAIWSDALQRELGLGLTDLGHYRAVLVIPALYK